MVATTIPIPILIKTLRKMSSINKLTTYMPEIQPEYITRTEDQSELPITIVVKEARGVHCTKHVRVYVSAQKGY